MSLPDSLPSILIVSDQAPAYAEALSALVAEGVTITLAMDATEAVAVGAEAPVVLGEPHHLAEALPGLSAVRWIQSTWAGVTPLLPVLGPDIQLTGVKGVFGQQMAEYCLGHMLAFELGILERAAAQADRHWDESATGNLAGKRLGVMGTGSIGAAVARAAAGLGLRVTGYNRSGKPVTPFEAVSGADQLGDFLAGLDYLVTVLPDTPDTRNLLDAGALARLPPHAVLINVGRGTVVEDAALVAALQDGQLKGAVLDVFREEPLPRDHAFWDTPGLRITGHVAAHSYPADIAALFIDNYRRYVAGEPLAHRVDPARGY